MDKQEITALLEGVRAGSVSVEDAVLQLKTAPIRELGAYAKVDLHRGLRQGVPEVIYGAGKTPEQILGIARAMRENGQETVLVTRMSGEAAELVEKELPLRYDPLSKAGIIGRLPEPNGKGKVVVATGGTSDMAVAGMEGALPSVIGGLADCPVIAVPTSVGYGASLGGVAALLSMLNSCASGVSVVNIDNGFGAGYMASMINHLD